MNSKYQADRHQVNASAVVTGLGKPCGTFLVAIVPMVTWCTIDDRFKPPEGYILLRICILYGSDKTDRNKQYYWPTPPTMEVKGHSKE